MSLDVTNASGVNRLGMSFQNSIFAASFHMLIFIVFYRTYVIRINCIGDYKLI